MMTSLPLLALALQNPADAAARAAGGLEPLTWAFMLASMGGATLLMIWCFSRILKGKTHFDPDGTGPAHSPVPGEAEHK